MYSGVIVRCVLAASTLEAGKTAAKAVMAAVAAHRVEFNSSAIAADRKSWCHAQRHHPAHRALQQREACKGLRDPRPRWEVSGTANMLARTVSVCRPLSWSTDWFSPIWAVASGR